MKSIGFGRLLLDARHITGLGFDLEDARLVAGAQSTGAPARLYVGKAEGQVSELVRQLLRMRADAYVFQVTPHTLSATDRLAAGLNALRPAARILYWGEGEGGANSVMPACRAEDAWAALAPILGFAADATMFSPYLSSVLSAEALLGKGVTARQDPAALADELRWADGQSLSDGDTIPVHAEHADAATLATVLPLLSESPVVGRLTVRVTTDALDDATAAALARLPLAGATVIGVGAGHTLLNGAAYPVEQMDSSSEDLRARAYGRNGALIMHTGNYFDSRSPGVQHIQMSATKPHEDRTAVYRWLDDAMLIRSAAVISGSPADLVDLSAEPVAETGGWPSHLYALRYTPDGQVSIVFDGRDQTSLPTRYIGLADLADATIDEVGATIVTISRTTDVTELERRLAAFHTGGQMSVPNPNTMIVYENNCRWMRYGGCTLAMLRRLQVADDGAVRNCRDAGQVGFVGEPFDRMAVAVRQSQQLEEARRGCATCSVREDCSRCTQLPAEWGGDYCRIRNDYPLTALYFELHSFPFLLSPKLVPEGSRLNLSVSYAGLPQCYSRSASVQERTGARPILVKLGEQYFAWWRGTRRIVRLSAPLAIIAESWWLGAEEGDVRSDLVQTFNVSLGVAATSHSQGLEKLRAGGVILG